MAKGVTWLAVPSDIAFCFCLELGFIEAVDLAPAFFAAAAQNKVDHKVYKQVFPDLSQERRVELQEEKAQADEQREENNEQEYYESSDSGGVSGDDGVM